MTAATRSRFRSAAGTSWVSRASSFGSGLRRAVALAPLALAAVGLPAHASHRALPAPRAVASAHTSHAGRSSNSRPAAHTTSAAKGRHAATAERVLPASSRTRGGRLQSAASSRTARPLTRRERAQAEAESRAEERTALHSRSGKLSHGHLLAAEQTGHDRLARETSSTRSGRAHGEVAAKHAVEPLESESAVDRRTEDRVHAWYRNRRDAGDDRPSANMVLNATTARATKPTLSASQTVSPDLSPAPPKATAADFARAAAAQRQTMDAARDQQARQTTEADDSADADSHIPSTAPTEREPLPFTHGSFDGGDNRSQRSPAPVVRTPTLAAPATLAAAVQTAPPQHVDLKHRGDGLNTALQGENTAANASKLQTPQLAGMLNGAPKTVSALAEQTAASPTPRLKLAAPPAAALHHSQPAAAAVNGTHAIQLDPAVAAGMTESTFDDDGAPATARTAIALANGLPVRGKVSTLAEADGDSLASALVSPTLFDRQGHLILVAPMKGSHEILVHQNTMAVSDGLNRIQDDRDLANLRLNKQLVALPDEDSTYPDDRLPANRRYARPWTVRFLRDLARAHYARFGSPLIVTSAARTVEFQRHLVRVNGNAAPPTGDIASPHLYGQAIDIGKRGMGITELTWMRAYLTPVENDGKIDVEEEFQQSCFHISVYRRYLGLPAQRPTPAPAPLLNATTAPAVTSAPLPETRRHRIGIPILATGIR